MSQELLPVGRGLILFGAVLILLGISLLMGPKLSWLGLGRLPGDLVIHRGSMTYYIPVATCLILSVVMSLILWLAGRWGR